MRYDPAFDYRQYEVTHEDAPLISAGEAAARLGVTTSQAVRSMIRRGALPAAREARSYNPRYLLPEWAVEGYAATRISSRDVTSVPRSQDEADRERTLEDALAAVREAREHEERARVLQIEAARELGAANDILHRAVTDVLVPPTIGAS